LNASRYESFCLGALEAMACGVPVLATAVGGLPEVVLHGQTGYFYPVGDHAVAIDRAVELLSDHDQHQALREVATRHARLFDQTRIVSIYEAIYLQLSSHSRHAPSADGGDAPNTTWD
jgi:glycosyltransferase involved in cell wall biosynthesis